MLQNRLRCYKVGFVGVGQTYEPDNTCHSVPTTNCEFSSLFCGARL
jgi:hypothetical protein